MFVGDMHRNLYSNIILSSFNLGTLDREGRGMYVPIMEYSIAVGATLLQGKSWMTLKQCCVKET